MTSNNSTRDSLIRIKNGYKARKKTIILQRSNLCIEILKILRQEGYIKGFQVGDRSINVLLKYFRDKPVIKDIIYYSPLSAKTTVSFKQLKQLCENKSKKTNGLNLNILSTSLGLLSDYTCLDNRLGGKLLLMII